MQSSATGLLRSSLSTPSTPPPPPTSSSRPRLLSTAQSHSPPSSAPASARGCARCSTTAPPPPRHMPAALPLPTPRPHRSSSPRTDSWPPSTLSYGYHPPPLSIPKLHPIPPVGRRLYFPGRIRAGWGDGRVRCACRSCCMGVLGLHPRARTPHCGGCSASASAAGQPATAVFAMCARLCLTRRARRASTASCSGCTASRQTATGALAPALRPSVANSCRPLSLLTPLLLPAAAPHLLPRRPLSSRMAGAGARPQHE